MIRSFRADLERLGRESAQQRAILDSKTGRVWTYSMLLDTVAGFARTMHDAGAHPGDRVFSVLPNSAEQFVAFLAALWAGIDFCPVSPLAVPDETVRCVQATGAALGLVPERIDGAVAGRLREATRQEALIPVAVDGDLTRYVGQARGLLSDAHDTGKLLVFTSGTTSHPKAVVLNGDRLWSSAWAWADFHRLIDSESRFYNILPMSYLGGLFNLGLIPLACAGSVVLSDAFSGRLALTFWREVKQHGVNTLWFSPTMLRALANLHKPSAELDDITEQLRLGFVGMAPISTAEKEEFERRFALPLLENFALTETTFLTSEALDQLEHRCVGRMLPWVELRLTPSLPAPSKMEIQAKTPFLFEGYLEPTGQVSQPETSDGFFPTGDLGELDRRGELTLRGRVKDVVKKGGYLVSLRDIEEAVEGHRLVKDAVAVGVADDFYGESSVLCVQLSDEAGSTREALAELRRTLTSMLAKFKWPAEIVVLDAFPRAENGKVQKWVLSSWLDTRHRIIDALSLR